jgi:transcriptional regulator NrdR family protein
MHEGGPSIDIIKRDGRRPTESFDHKKLHASIVAACLTAGTPHGQADTIATKVIRDVITWLQDHQEVTSSDLRRITAKHLRTHHPDAGYLYEQHRITL